MALIPVILGRHDAQDVRAMFFLHHPEPKGRSRSYPLAVSFSQDFCVMTVSPDR